MRFTQTESVLQTKNRSGPAKNQFSVALNESQFTFFHYKSMETLKLQYQLQ